MAHCDDAPLTLTIRSPDESGALVPQTAFSFNISPILTTCKSWRTTTCSGSLDIASSKCDDDDEARGARARAGDRARGRARASARARAEACCGADSPPRSWPRARRPRLRASRAAGTPSPRTGATPCTLRWRHLLHQRRRERRARPLRAPQSACGRAARRRGSSMTCSCTRARAGSASTSRRLRARSEPPRSRGGFRGRVSRGDGFRGRVRRKRPRTRRCASVRNALRSCCMSSTARARGRETASTPVRALILFMSTGTTRAPARSSTWCSRAATAATG